jgi:hypothetical protein
MRMPALEVVTVIIQLSVVIDYSPRHDVSAALKALPRLREVYFGVQRGRAALESRIIRRILPLASYAGLLTFSEVEFPEPYDPFTTFSN